ESRLQNLEIVIGYLNKYFDTVICVIEADQISHTSQFVKEHTRYFFQSSESPLFHRTAINNRLIHSCNTPLAVLYDADIIIIPQQLHLSATAIRESKHAFALPYDGRFLQVDYYNKRLFQNNLDIDFLLSGTGIYTTDTRCSVGGCFMFNVEEYKKCGMENENIEGWGHDDAERVKRLQKSGYDIFRPRGPLYHLWHERKQNSYFFDEAMAVKSFQRYFNTCSVSVEALQKEIKEWPWALK
ncbi:MAG: hypothetical protein IT250_12780, partial [Chitinophagaceae bacterium]|nr:hypothetical protein [Chitinophagaceae bacterium]